MSGPRPLSRRRAAAAAARHRGRPTEQERRRVRSADSLARLDTPRSHALLAEGGSHPGDRPPVRRQRSAPSNGGPPDLRADGAAPRPRRSSVSAIEVSRREHAASSTREHVRRLAVSRSAPPSCGSRSRASTGCRGRCWMTPRRGSGSAPGRRGRRRCPSGVGPSGPGRRSQLGRRRCGARAACSVGGTTGPSRRGSGWSNTGRPHPRPAGPPACPRRRCGRARRAVHGSATPARSPRTPTTARPATSTTAPAAPPALEAWLAERKGDTDA